MERILVPVDFSDASLHAALFACQVADKIKTTVFLLHVLELGHEKLYQPFSLHEKYNKLVSDERKEELQQFEEQLGLQNKQVQVASHLKTGPIVETILKFAKEENIDLIISGNTGAGKATRILFGSVAKKLIQNCELPVIAVPKCSRIEIPAAIVFATSHFEKDQQVLGPIIQLAKLFQSKVHIIFFIDADVEDIPDHIDHAMKLEYYKKYINSLYPDMGIEFEIIKGSLFEDTVERFEKQHGAGLLALVPYAKTLFEKMRSTSDKMAFCSSVPVLIVPPCELKREDEFAFSSSKASS